MNVVKLGESEKEDCSFPGFTLCANPASMLQDNPFHRGKPDTGSGELIVAVQAVAPIILLLVLFTRFFR